MGTRPSPNPYHAIYHQEIDLTRSPSTSREEPLNLGRQAQGENSNDGEAAAGSLSMEENNNDPNNNSDHAQVSQPERFMARDEPQPGCSKDFAASNSSDGSVGMRNKILSPTDSTSDGFEDSAGSVAVKMRPNKHLYERVHSKIKKTPNPTNLKMGESKANETLEIQDETLYSSEESNDYTKDSELDDYYDDASDDNGIENYFDSPETIQSSSPERISITDEDESEANESDNDDEFSRTGKTMRVIEKDVECLLHLFPHIEKKSASDCFFKHRNRPNKSELVIEELLHWPRKVVPPKRKIDDNYPIETKKIFTSTGPKMTITKEQVQLPMNQKNPLSPAKFKYTPNNGHMNEYKKVNKAVLQKSKLNINSFRASSTVTSGAYNLSLAREAIPGPSRIPAIIPFKPVASTSKGDARAPEKLPIVATQQKIRAEAQGGNVPNVVTIDDNSKADSNDEKVPQNIVELVGADRDRAVQKLPQPSLYYELANMFPNVSRGYIIASCMKYKSNHAKELMFHELIDNMLNNGDRYPRVAEEPLVEIDLATQQQNEAMNLEEQYDTLLKIFPDADPTYLRRKVEELHKNPRAYEEFVQETMENKNYPSKESFMKKMKLLDQVKQYTTDFNIEQFLKIFPDPDAYFTDAKRTTNEALAAVAYLKHKYSKFRVTTISKTFHRLKNLTLTCSSLDQMKPDMSSKRAPGALLPSDNIPFIQEVAFLDHREEIKKYLTEKHLREEKEFQELKEAGQLLECQCCYNDECLPSLCFNCNDGHVFCKECLIRGTESKLSDGDAHIQCFANCKEEFPLSVLQKVLEPTKFSILLRKRQEAEVMAAGLEGLVSCPFCHFSSIPPPEDKVFRCFNPDCMKESCRACKEPNHVPYKCEELQSVKSRHYIEEKMTKALLRTCYRCKKQFCKDGGCNRMTCTCGALMCYICDQPVKDYTHFRGQGLDNPKLCPLYTDDKRIDAEVVRRTALLAEKEVLEKNPNLKLDTATILPAVPKPQTGPHQAIVNANELPEHALRVRAYVDHPQ